MVLESMYIHVHLAELGRYRNGTGFPAYAVPMRAWIELPPGSGWGDTRAAASGLHELGYVTAEQRSAGRILLRLSGSELDVSALWVVPP